MARIEAYRLLEIIACTEYEPRQYSGRGMRDKQCIGVVVDDIRASLADLVIECDDTEEAYSLILDARDDNMGRSTILYWPHTEWPEEKHETCETD